MELGLGLVGVGTRVEVEAGAGADTGAGTSLAPRYYRSDGTLGHDHMCAANRAEEVGGRGEEVGEGRGEEAVGEGRGEEAVGEGRREEASPLVLVPCAKGDRYGRWYGRRYPPLLPSSTPPAPRWNYDPRAALLHHHDSGKCLAVTR